jgi:hypothetical protein
MRDQKANIFLKADLGSKLTRLLPLNFPIQLGMFFVISNIILDLPKYLFNILLNIVLKI